MRRFSKSEHMFLNITSILMFSISAYGFTRYSSHAAFGLIAVPTLGFASYVLGSLNGRS